MAQVLRHFPGAALAAHQVEVDLRGACRPSPVHELAIEIPPDRDFGSPGVGELLVAPCEHAVEVVDLLLVGRH